MESGKQVDRYFVDNMLDIIPFMNGSLKAIKNTIRKFDDEIPDEEDYSNCMNYINELKMFITSFKDKLTQKQKELL